MPRVFYSWQSDLPAREHRDLIQRALKGALRELPDSIGAEFTDFESTRTGNPKMDDALEDAISASAAFVGDVTLTGRRPGTNGGRPCPNPNVCVELGIARGLLGSEGVVLIMNTASGPPGELPADLGAFIPCAYEVAAGASDAVIAAAEAALRSKLAAELARSIHAHFFCDFAPSDVPAVARVVQWLVGPESTQHGRSFSLVPVSDLARRVELDAQVVRAALEELEALGLAEDRSGAGQRGPYRGTRRLLAAFDPLFLGWNPRSDAARLAAELLQSGGMRTDELADRLGWRPRRLNPAITVLCEANAVQWSKAIAHESPYVTEQLVPQPALRRFVRRVELREHG
jgi:DNA-binding MarR family transcriptional regulator